MIEDLVYENELWGVSAIESICSSSQTIADLADMSLVLIEQNIFMVANASFGYCET